MSQEDRVNRHANTIGLFGAGLLGGLALGLGAGILLAPRSGRESRDSVRRGVIRSLWQGPVLR